MNCNYSSALSISQIQSPTNLSFLQPTGLLFKSSNPLIPPHFHKFGSAINPLRISSISKSTPTPPVQCSFILKTSAQQLAILLVGGLIFMGRFSCKPAFAIPSSPKTVEEMKEAKNEDDGDGNGNDELYVKMLEKNPRDVQALKVVLSNKMMKGNTKEALVYVERLIEVEPEEVEWRLLQALSYEMMGDLSKAKMLFKDILKERPLLLRALHGLAMVMHKNREGPGVFEMLNKALELAKREKRVIEERNIRILIGQMHVVKGELEDGLKKFHALVDENPRDFRPYLCQGIIYSLLDKKKEAEEQFETYRSLVPQEFPQRGFLDDVVLAAKTESREQLQKEFQTEFSMKTK